MTNTTKSVLIAIVALVIGFVGGILVPSTGQPAIRGTAYDPLYQVAPIYSGQGQQIIADRGALVGPSAGTQFSVLPIATSTALGASFLCQYSVITMTTSTASVTSTLPTATNATACLTQDGDQKDTMIQIAKGNAWNMVIATSTGDTLTWNGTSTAGGATLASSTAGSFWKLSAIRYSSTSIVYTIGNMGTAH